MKAIKIYGIIGSHITNVVRLFVNYKVFFDVCDAVDGSPLLIKMFNIYIRWTGTFLWLRLWWDPKISFRLEWVFSVGLFFGFEFCFEFCFESGLLIVTVISENKNIDKLSTFWNSISTIFTLFYTTQSTHQKISYFYISLCETMCPLKEIILY